MTPFDKLFSELKHRISSDSWLKARQHGRLRFAPELGYGRHFAPPFSTSKPAAVLVLLEPSAAEGEDWSIPLTVRPQHLPDHPGQISFPGGRLEAGESALDAAKREYEEELGKPFQGAILGELFPLFVYNSNYAVRPFLAICESSQTYQPCPQEVERVVNLPLNVLVDERCQPISQFSRGTVSWTSRVFAHKQDQVWGATAIMLGEVAAIVRNLE
ncbi:MAG: CoA pyrophosphatase [Planctomycetota bacterium]